MALPHDAVHRRSSNQVHAHRNRTRPAAALIRLTSGHAAEKRWNNALTHVTEMERRLEEAGALAPQLTAEQPSTSSCTGLGVRTPNSRYVRIGRVITTTSTRQEVTELIRELALVCEDTSIVSILNRLRYRTGNGNTWTEKRVQHVRHTNGFPACPPTGGRPWITMHQAAAALRVSEMVVRRLIAQKTLPAKQIVKFAPWMIERTPGASRGAQRDSSSSRGSASGMGGQRKTNGAIHEFP